jgi:hypothetical protein
MFYLKTKGKKQLSKEIIWPNTHQFTIHWKPISMDEPQLSYQGSNFATYPGNPLTSTSQYLVNHLHVSGYVAYVTRLKNAKVTT